MPDTLNILLQSDENYAPFAGVMLTSLFENNKNISEINIYILTVDMSQKNRSKFSDLAKKYYRRIMILDASKIDKFCETNSVRKWKNSYTAYYRLFALSIINEDIDRLIYLDSDMLVLKELIDLTKINLGDNVVGMCLDSIPETHKKRIGLKTNYYYNSGMILFNVKRWLTEGWMNKIVRHICNVQNRYPLPDQDLLNIILEGKILTLPITYNTHSYLYIYLDYNLVKDIYGMKTYWSKNEF